MTDRNIRVKHINPLPPVRHKVVNVRRYRITTGVVCDYCGRRVNYIYTVKSGRHVLAGVCGSCFESAVHNLLEIQ